MLPIGWLMTRLHCLTQVIVLTTAGLLIGCGQSDSAAAGSVKKVEITPSQATIKPQGRQLFSVVAKDANGQAVSGVAFRWVSTNADVVSVDSTGLATGQGEGVAFVQVGVSQTGTGVEISPTALASLRVTQTAARPVEIIGLHPSQGETVSIFRGPRPSDCGGPCPGGPPTTSGLSVLSLFSNGDEAASARLVFDNTDVTAGAELTSQLSFRPNGVWVLWYVFAQTPSVGLHSVAVELRSKQGKLVSYSWSFTAN